jgi:LmbE family N-acetylglucosaminyl deacetylase
MTVGNLNVSGKVILAVSAHPDDMEVYCGGTLAKWAKQGARVHHLILTDGSKGYEDHLVDCQELIETRKSEEKNASQVLGLEEPIFLNFVDGELDNNLDLRKAIVKIIRELKPEIIICMDPTFIFDSEKGRINHPDHRVAAQATLDAVFPFARNSRSFPDLMEQGFVPHIVTTVLLTQFNQGNFYVDISETFDQKIKCLSCHKSQFPSIEKSIEVWTERAEKLGVSCSSKYGECFIKIDLSNNTRVSS